MIRLICTYYQLFLAYIPFYYYDLHAPKVGFLLEIQTNKDGYKNSITKSSRDQYTGLTVIGGIDLNIKTNLVSINFGIQYDFRNH